MFESYAWVVDFGYDCGIDLEPSIELLEEVFGDIVESDDSDPGETSTSLTCGKGWLREGISFENCAKL